MSHISPMIRMVSSVVCATLVIFSAPAYSRGAPDSFADKVEVLMPAVVNISTTQKLRGGGLTFPNMQDPMMDEQLRDLFEKLLPPGSNGLGSPMERETQSLGSGFIVDPDGYVVTNNHVIEGASEIHVVLSDDTKLDAKVIGHDTKTDVALLKVESKEPLPYVRFGDSDTARVGDWVIAIGNPFGLGGTVTAGIISARARNINAGPFDDFIQTDASINRGNSGGPLFNLDGDVIGINTAIFSPSGGSIGIGFAVPSALAKPVINQLKEHGRTFRGWLGVKIQPVDEKVADSLGMKRAYGALVAEVTPDSPAAKAGLEVRDVITHFDGRAIDEMRLLPRMVAETKIGKKTEVTVLRNGKTLNLDVTLGELEEETPVTAANQDPKIEPSDVATYSFNGMKLADIDSDLRKRLALKSDISGVVVVELERSSEAAKQGIAFGDVIQQVNDTKITSINGFKKAMNGVKRKHALLQVWRDKTTVFITIPSEEDKRD
ncbi:MAG: DegQ family serine endoprotease [Alphaproteobacteria bacterium]|nr:DegQ family serine endoprotease [Alphaproteobacteria bacterium]